MKEGQSEGEADVDPDSHPVVEPKHPIVSSEIELESQTIREKKSML